MNPLTTALRSVRKTLPLAAFGILAATSAAYTQHGAADVDHHEEATSAHREPIHPNRPGLAESTHTVGAGTLQVEGGYSFARTPEHSSHNIGELLVRYGVGERAELLVGLSSYAIGFDHDVRTAGFRDVSIGARTEIAAGHGLLPAAALVVGSTLPTGGHSYRNDELQPRAALALGWSLPGHWSLNTTAGYAHLSEAGERVGEATAAAVLGYEFTHRFHAHAEYAQIGEPDHFADGIRHLSGGVGYHLTDDIALDLWAGAARAHGEDELLFGVGMARRW